MHMVAVSFVQVFISLQLLECINDPPINKYYIPTLLAGFAITSVGFLVDVYSNYQDIGLRLIVNAAVWLVGWALFLYYYKLRRDRGRLGDNASFLILTISWCVYLIVGVWVVGIMIKAI